MWDKASSTSLFLYWSLLSSALGLRIKHGISVACVDLVLPLPAEIVDSAPGSSDALVILKAAQALHFLDAMPGTASRSELAKRIA